MVGRPRLPTEITRQTLHYCIWCYVSTLEQLFDQVTLHLIAARGELVRRALSRGEDEPDADNPVVLFGHPIETLRLASAVNQDALMTPEVLRRLLGAHSNRIVANNPRDGHPRSPNPTNYQLRMLLIAGGLDASTHTQL